MCNRIPPTYRFSVTYRVPTSARPGFYAVGSAFSFSSVVEQIQVPCPPPDPNRPPVGIAGGPYTGSVGQPIRFDGSRSTDPDGDALSYLWNFGDESSGVCVNPLHIYSTSGVYATLAVS